MNKKKINQFIVNFITYSLLFSVFINQCAYATNNDTVDSILTEVVRVLLVIGGLVCVGKLIQIGIMYMMISVDQKSNAKQAILPWLVGTIVCFGAAWIGSAIVNIIKVDDSQGVLNSY